MRRIFTKVVATLGPGSDTPEIISALFEAGADVFRINMSHGEHASHAAAVQAVRAASAAAGRPAGILCDISGPKIRIGEIPLGPVMLLPGDEITVTPEPCEGTASRVSVNYHAFHADVEPGQRVLLDDGLLEWEAVSVTPPEVTFRVIRGGPLSSHKGINLPNSRLSLSSITEKDRADIAFGLEHDADMFAISFVRRAEDIREAREHMQSLGGDLPLIAKIEKREAVENIESIMKEADGAMVARGDLGVEIPLEQVPHVQKRVITLCNRLGKPVITATQMLDSMIRSPRPTRAEVTDVANAILDGTDATMLSGETAVGLYPTEAVHIMNNIAAETEKHFDYKKWLRKRHLEPETLVQDAITTSAAMVAQDLGVSRILCLTQGGSTARRVARYRPSGGVLAYCPLARTAQQLCLSWGVTALAREDALDPSADKWQSTEAEIRTALTLFRTQGMLEKGERIVVAAGLPLHCMGTTNMIRVTEVE